MLAQGGSGIQGHLDARLDVEGDEEFHPTGKKGVRNIQAIPSDRGHHLDAVYDQTMIHAGGPVNGRPEPSSRDAYRGHVHLNGRGCQISPGGSKPAVTVDEAREIQASGSGGLVPKNAAAEAGRHRG